jgi:hypothetical protein
VRRAVAGIGMGLEREEDLSRTAWTEVEREGWEERSRSRVDIGGGRGALVISSRERVRWRAAQTEQLRG